MHSSPLQATSGPSSSTSLASPFPSYQVASAQTPSSSASRPTSPAGPSGSPKLALKPQPPTAPSSSKTFAVKTPEKLAAEREKKRLKSQAKRERLRLARAETSSSNVGKVAGPGDKAVDGGTVSVEVREVRWSSSSSPAPDRVEHDTPCPVRSSPKPTAPPAVIPSASTAAPRQPRSPAAHVPPPLDLSLSTTTADSEPRTPPATPVPLDAHGQAVDKFERKRLKKKEKAVRQKAAKKEAAAAAAGGHAPVAQHVAASPATKQPILNKKALLRTGPPLGPVLVALPKPSAAARRSIPPSSAPPSSGPRAAHARGRDLAAQDDARRTSALAAITGYRPSSSLSPSFVRPRKEAIVVRLPTAANSLASASVATAASPSEVRLKPPTRRHSPSPLRIVSPKPVHQPPRSIPLLSSRTSSDSGLATPSASRLVEGEVAPVTHPEQSMLFVVDYQQQQYQPQPPPPQDFVDGPGLSYQSEYPPRPYPPPPAPAMAYPSAHAAAPEHLMRSVMLPPGYMVDGGVYYDPATGQPYVYAYPTPPPPSGAGGLQQHQQWAPQQQQVPPPPPPGPSPSPDVVPYASAGVAPPPSAAKFALGPRAMPLPPLVMPPPAQPFSDDGGAYSPYGPYPPPPTSAPEHAGGYPYALSPPPPHPTAAPMTAYPAPAGSQLSHQPPFAYAHSPSPGANGPYGHLQSLHPHPSHYGQHQQPVFIPRRPGSAAVRISAPEIGEQAYYPAHQQHQHAGQVHRQTGAEASMMHRSASAGSEQHQHVEGGTVYN